MVDIPEYTDVMNHRLFSDALYADQQEHKWHTGSMLAIAEETGRPLQTVTDLYENLLRDLKARARITDYLPILISKKIKEIYRHN
jgi:hypothetical protein